MGLTLRHFRKILIANRGEIAVRIERTCRQMGIWPVVAFAGQAAPVSSYLDVDAILDAAKKNAADAIHPGYGFLSESAEFAEACERAGLVFIGPPASVIRQMGLKTAARRIAAGAGLPIVPDGASEFPVLIKAAAGGGGRGMRIVRRAGEMDEALRSARSEAERAFGDGTLLVEKFIEGARHVEVQIFGDRHGNLIHLFERDCTTQRRFQKIVEESPCPILDEERRTRLCEAAVALGRKIGYVNAGTVEFLLAPDGAFYFMEVNPRIQVEHPVTEMVTGLDLIRMQIEVAEGYPLHVRPASTGHAIEARLYAEDPDNEFLPTAGVIRWWRPPERVRVDTAIETGAEVGIEYDPLLAKIVAHGRDRESAVRKLVYALRSTRIFGVKTNLDYLIRQLDPDAVPAIEDRWAEQAAKLYLEHTRPRPLPGVPPNWRNNPFRRESEGAVSVVAVQPGWITLASDGVQSRFGVKQAGEEVYVFNEQGSRTLKIVPRFAPNPGSASQGAANSPMPGKVLRIPSSVGQIVRPGDPLVILEAMKMEQTIRAAIDGVVKRILVRLGQVVAPGQVLVEINPQESV